MLATAGASPISGPHTPSKSCHYPHHHTLIRIMEDILPALCTFRCRLTVTGYHGLNTSARCSCIPTSVDVPFHSWNHKSGHNINAPRNGLFTNVNARHSSLQGMSLVPTQHLIRIKIAARAIRVVPTGFRTVFSFFVLGFTFTFTFASVIV